MSTGVELPRPRRSAWAVTGALAVSLAVLTCAVGVGWGPLIAVDVRIVLAARAAVAAHAAVVAPAIAVTDAGSPVAVDVVTAVAVVVLLLRRRLGDSSYVLLVRLVALGAETALKHGLARPRPDVVPLTTAAGFSFPSGHATGTTALCASLLVLLVPVLDRQGRAVVVAAAVLVSVAVAASRVLLGVHYPSDVAGGLLLGALVAVLLAVVPLGRHADRVTGASLLSAGSAASTDVGVDRHDPGRR
jgi:undecaprenyl-diphosphatase